MQAHRARKIFQRGRISCRAEKLKKGGISNFVNNGSGCSSNSYSICLHRSTGSRGTEKAS